MSNTQNVLSSEKKILASIASHYDSEFTPKGKTESIKYNKAKFYLLNDKGVVLNDHEIGFDPEIKNLIENAVTSGSPVVVTIQFYLSKYKDKTVAKARISNVEQPAK